jgi:hypothetical protein
MNTTPSEETIDADWWEGICEWCGGNMQRDDYDVWICVECAFDGADE